jgi:hypothetical protein
MGEEPEIRIVETKGVRKDLQVIQNTNLAVYRREDKLVVAKLAIPPLGEELKGLFREIEEQSKGKKKPTEKQTREHRVKKQARKMA